MLRFGAMVNRAGQTPVLLPFFLSTRTSYARVFLFALCLFMPPLLPGHLIAALGKKSASAASSTRTI